jgi:hypothetical protein
MKSFGVKATSLGLVLAAGGVLAACSGGGGLGGDMTVKADQVQGAWPLTVDAIKIECTDDMSIYAVANDKVYPLNGQAERMRQAPDKKAVEHLEDIQKDDPEAAKYTPGAKMSLDPVRIAAIQKCQKAGKWTKSDAS